MTSGYLEGLRDLAKRLYFSHFDSHRAKELFDSLIVFSLYNEVALVVSTGVFGTAHIGACELYPRFLHVLFGEELLNHLLTVAGVQGTL